MDKVGRIAIPTGIRKTLNMIENQQIEISWTAKMDIVIRIED